MKLPLIAAAALGCTAWLATPLLAADAAPSTPPAAEVKNLLPDTAEEAWTAVQKALRPPPPPAEWNDRKPEEKEQEAYRKVVATSAGSAADRAKEFYTRFPKDTHAGEAKDLERNALAAAVRLGDDSRKAALEALGGENQPPADPFTKKVQAAIEAARAVQAKEGNGDPRVLAKALIPSVRGLKKEFPDRQDLDGLLFQCAQLLEGEPEGLALLKELQAQNANPELKQQATALLKKAEAVGKPVKIAFTAVDGRKIDVADMKGKVVLVDFWATWCGPCVQELPNVKRAYDELHAQGFEIVGISFDQDEQQLKDFIKKKEMPWAQYFDGEGWKNKFGQEYGINSIPAMWLVDRKGNLRYANARPDLEGKVKELLAEK